MAPGIRFDRYEIVSRLALGGMAEVWLGVVSGAAGFRKKVAVKTILPELVETDVIVEMFTREARLAAGLSHPNIVQVFDFGELEGTYYMTMEYVAGRTLRETLRRARIDRQLPPLWFALRTLTHVCDAVQGLHDVGLLHHDLSPENVMVAYSGATKLIDFGASEPARTRPKGRTVVGKFRYVAPERLEGAAPDRRSDVYSLGVLLYELLTGERPFDGDDTTVLRAILRGQPPDPRSHNPQLSEELAAIVLRAMARQPEARYRQARQLGEELERLARADGVTDTDSGSYLTYLFAPAEGSWPEPDDEPEIDTRPSDA